MITCTFDDGGTGSLRHVCVDAIVVKEGKVLMGKRSQKVSTEPGKFCLPGGYLDRGEQTIDCARREVHEETGYQVKEGLLFHIRDYPADIRDLNRQNIAFTYIFTDPVEDDTNKLDWDSDKPQWFGLDTIDTVKDSIAFDHWAILSAYRQHLKTPLTLPVINALSMFPMSFT